MLQPIQNSNQIAYKQNVSTEDISTIVVDDYCRGSYPCKHNTTVTLYDGRSALISDGFSITSIVFNVLETKISDSQITKDHFAEYKEKNKNKIPDPDELLTQLFSTTIPSTHKSQ